ncbi:MAG: dephospho-CoA kinase [Saprospiraceae bacterium]|nr:dephospho-CoA kinase [Saprospiraceae bacterium]
MLKVGITGGIGSGKTTVCRIFEQLGIPVYYADNRAKWLMSHDESLVAAIKAEFGEQAYPKPGVLDRAYLASIIFQDKSKLERMNQIVHPAVFKDSAQWQTDQAKTNTSYSLKEAALLFESGSYAFLDKIIVVTAPDDLRIQRVMQRDKVNEAAVKARMAKQMPQADKIAKADFVIENIEQASLQAQVEKIHQELVAL